MAGLIGDDRAELVGVAASQRNDGGRSIGGRPRIVTVLSVLHLYGLTACSAGGFCVDYDRIDF